MHQARNLIGQDLTFPAFESVEVVLTISVGASYMTPRLSDEILESVHASLASL
jgi:hypothetical protein